MCAVCKNVIIRYDISKATLKYRSEVNLFSFNRRQFVSLDLASLAATKHRISGLTSNLQIQRFK